MIANVENNLKEKHKKKAFMPTKSFFWYFKPIAIISKLVGVLPLKHILHSDSSRLKFSILSMPFLYSTLLFMSNIVAMVSFGDPLNILEDLRNVALLYFWRFVVLLLITVRSLLCFYFCVSHSGRLVKLIQVLDVFDTKKTITFKANAWEAVKRFVIWTIMPIIVDSLLVSTICFELYGFAQTTLEVVPSLKYTPLFFSFLGVWTVTPLLLYIYFAFIIYYNFNYIKNMIFKNIIIPQRQPDEFRPPPDFKEMLKSLCQMYFLLGTAVKHINIVFGSFLAIDQFYIIVMYVVNLYVYFFTNNRDNNLLLCIITNAVVVLVAIYISHEVSEEADKILQILQEMPLWPMDLDSKIEVQTLLTQMFASSIHISAAGYFKMNRGQLPSILSSIATYLIVFIQFPFQYSNENLNATMQTLQK